MIDPPIPVWIARWFRGAALYGVAALSLLVIGGPGHDPVYRYGFLGTALACQWLYWTIGGDPPRYRRLMLVAVFAKLGFAVPVAILFARGAASGTTLAFGGVDLAIAAGFALARRATPDWKAVPGAST